jgi:DNA-binding NtrC family response regulator
MGSPLEAARVSSSPLVLVADSDSARRRRVVVTLLSAACQVREILHVSQLMPFTRRCPPAAVLLGFSVREESEAFAVIARLRHVHRLLPVLVVVDEGSEALAVRALRAGVTDYFTEPIAGAQLAASVRAAVAVGPADPAAAASVMPPAGTLVAASESMQRLITYLDRVARHDSTVLITGETGTGKELAATFIHDRSPRARARFVSINCAAIPDGLLESELFGYESGAFTGASARREGLLQVAEHGTVFFDEIADLGPRAQAKILRALETREVYRVGGKQPVRLDVRVIAATNQDLERAVEEGRFRKDLYFRLNVARVHLPPLRERRADIGPLLDHYVGQLNRERFAEIEGFAPDVRGTLEAYDWPGNVRELRNLVEALFVAPSDRMITLADLPEALRIRLAATPPGEAERHRLVQALQAANWNKSQVASMLRCSRMTVYRKMAKYAVVRSSRPGAPPALAPRPETDVTPAGDTVIGD